jgi:hypothetical protein
MKRVAWMALMALLLLGSVAQAATFEGILTDARDGVSHLQYPEKLAGLQAAEVLNLEHEGLGVVVNGSFYRFEGASAERAAQLLRGADPMAENLRVRIDGAAVGGRIEVTNMQPAAGGFVRR